MNQLLLAIIFIVQVYQVHSRSTEDVLQDFGPVFEEIHVAIGGEQSLTQGEGKLLQRKYEMQLYERKGVTDLSIQKGFEELQEYRKRILSDNGLSEDSAAIAHCISEQKNDTQYFIGESYAGSNICARLGRNTSLESQASLFKFFDFQVKMHNNLEQSKKKCSAGNTPLEVQSCLIQELYFVHKPQVKEVEKQKHEILKRTQELLEGVIANIKVCFSIVDEEIMNKKEAIKKPFEYCVVKAVEGKS